MYEMYYIELATGLRRGELLGLKWTDVDWKNGVIKVRRSIARMNGEIVESTLKTKNSYRAVTISQQAIEVLKTQKAKTNDQYIFPSPNGGPISPDSVNNMLKRGQVSQRSDSTTCATPLQPSRSRMAWTSKQSAECWVTSPQASPSTPMHMSLPPHKKKLPRP